MKKLINLIVIIVCINCILATAQTNIFPASGSAGIGTTTPNASSLFEVKSTTKGMLIPRMTKAQRDAIISPATGLLIFQTTNTPGFYFFDGSAWKAVSSVNFANKNLDNLSAPTKINSELLPDTSGTIDLGSSSKAWKDIYLDGIVFNNGIKVISFEGVENSSVGENSGISITTGSDNAFFGGIAGSQNTTGSNNSFFGAGSGNTNTTGSLNTFVGINAGSSNTTANNNSFFGALAGEANTTGTSNAFFGAFAGASNTTAIANSFFGISAGSSNTTGESNSFFGKETGGSNTTGNNNSYFGSNAGSNSNSGSNNVFIGASTGFVNASNDNTFVGTFAGDANTTGTSNSFFGTNAGGANTTANDNTFIGNSTGLLNTTGNRNVFVGKGAGSSNTSANDNTFIGAAAGDVNTTGFSNVFLGKDAGGGNTNGSANTFIGKSAGAGNSTGGGNVFLGLSTGFANTSGLDNTFVGRGTGAANTLANSNTFIGAFAGDANTIGEENVLIGKDAGGNSINGSGVAAFGFEAGLTHSNSFCTFVGYQSDNASANNLSNANAFGHLSRATAANQVRIGNTGVGSIGGFVGFSNVSDGRYKKNIAQNVPGLEFINKLNPVTYTLDVKGLQTFLHENDNLNEIAKAINEKAATEKEKVIYTGFIAQEVEAAAKELNFDFSGIDKPQNKESLYGLRYAEFTVPLVKAVQELSKENEGLKSEVRGQKSEIEKLKSELAEIKNILHENSSKLSNQIELQNESATDQIGNAVPNPTGFFTTINYLVAKQFQQASILITDNSGATIKSIALTARRGEIKINVTSLSQGLYHYSLFVDGIKIESKSFSVIK